VLTGLDGLKVEGDASSTIDASEEGDAAVTPDVAAGDDASIDATGTLGVIHCGANTCSGGMACCITVLNQIPTYTCSKDCGGGTTIAVHCDDKSDCNGQMCCLSNDIAACSSTSTCANQLCGNDQQCSGGKCLPFDAGSGVTLSRCQ
jgi:hypothetical protein